MELFARKDEILSYVQNKCKKDGDCLSWMKSCDTKRYGRVTINNKSYTVSRLVLILESGEDRGSKMHACHAPFICHNPSCCNILHLRWGTAKENKQDSILEGTYHPQPKGEKHSLAKLTETQIKDIINSPKSKLELSKEYKVSLSHIYNIKAGRKWTHVK